MMVTVVTVPRGVARLMMSRVLHAIAESGSDYGPLRSTNQSASDGANHSSLGTAFGLRPVRLGEYSARRKHQGRSEHCSLNLV